MKTVSVNQMFALRAFLRLLLAFPCPFFFPVLRLNISEKKKSPSLRMCAQFLPSEIVYEHAVKRSVCRRTNLARLVGHLNKQFVNTKQALSQTSR